MPGIFCQGFSIETDDVYLRDLPHRPSLTNSDMCDLLKNCDSGFQPLILSLKHSNDDDIKFSIEKWEGNIYQNPPT